jgi:hypothetical protein
MPCSVQTENRHRLQRFARWRALALERGEVGGYFSGGWAGVRNTVYSG